MNMNNFYDGEKNYSETFKGFEYVGSTTNSAWGTCVLVETYRAWSKGILRYGRPAIEGERIHYILVEAYKPGLCTVGIVTWAGDKVYYYAPVGMESPSAALIDWAVGRYYQDTGYGCVDIDGVSFTWKMPADLRIQRMIDGPSTNEPQKVEIGLEYNGLPADELPVMSIELTVDGERLYLDGEEWTTTGRIGPCTLTTWAYDFVHAGTVEGFLTFGGRTR